MAVRYWQISTSASAVRGMSFNIIFLDEFAFIPNHIAEQFFASVYPTITSGKSTKVIIISTPNGMNHFYKLWVDAQKDRNAIYGQRSTGQKSQAGTLNGRRPLLRTRLKDSSPKNSSASFWDRLTHSSLPLKLRILSYDDPIQSNAGLDVYESPRDNHDYIVCVDVSRGLAQDYSAFVVIDITTAPWTLVAKYRDHDIRPMLLPNVILNVATMYNRVSYTHRSK